MRNKILRIVYSGTTLTVLLLAAGAKWRGK